MTAPDVVYICRASENNEQLRHSLRTLSNLPHTRIWLVGYKPRWVTGVQYLPVQQRGTKHANTWGNWIAAAGCADISEQFILFNDDFYVTRPTEQIPALHRGPLDAMIDWYAQMRATQHHQRAVTTRGLLRQLGHTELLSYELHTPMMVNRELLAEAIGWLQGHRRQPLHGVSKRTFYGNYALAGGQHTHDVKVQGAKLGLPETSLPFLSTSPSSWQGLAGGWIRRAFAEPSPYERERSGQMYRPPAHDGVRARVRA